MSVLKPYEKWKQIEWLTKMKLRKNYAVTNYGRIIAYKENIEEGEVVAKGFQSGYPALKLKPYQGKKNLVILVHKLVAEYFLEPKTEGQLYIIHKDHNKLNNRPDNLKWVTKVEWWAHWKKSEAVQANLKKLTAKKQVGHKLTSTDVIRIKRMLQDPNRKNSIVRIAQLFNVSDMQVYRIKTGENWSHVKI